MIKLDSIHDKQLGKSLANHRGPVAKLITKPNFCKSAKSNEIQNYLHMNALIYFSEAQFTKVVLTNLSIFWHTHTYFTDSWSVWNIIEDIRIHRFIENSKRRTEPMHSKIFSVLTRRLAKSRYWWFEFENIYQQSTSELGIGSSAATLNEHVPASLPAPFFPWELSRVKLNCSVSDLYNYFSCTRSSGNSCQSLLLREFDRFRGVRRT